MSLKEELNTALEGLNVRGLKIDKDADYCGDKATKISFVMTDPEGIHTGDLTFEAWYTDKLALPNAKIADLTRINAVRQASAFLFDREVEQ
jgi:hypothetical protein